MKRISFSAPMLLALRRAEAPKTQTRRAMRLQSDAPQKCPYGEVGSILTVSEAIRRAPDGGAVYTVDGAPVLDTHWKPLLWRWKVKSLPGIYMPGEAGRDVLRVIEVRAQRLQEITDAEIIAEGVTLELARELTGRTPATLREAWELGWDAINGAREVDGKPVAYAANPRIWAVSFERVRP